jgi:hypothetical protein
LSDVDPVRARHGCGSFRLIAWMLG